MSGGITDAPVAEALLRHLAQERGDDDPIGALAKGLLDGGSPSRELLRSSWLEEGLTEAVEKGRAELSRMSSERLAAIEEGAARLRSASGEGVGAAS
ncbi:hypothetical protein [Actinoplanes derwentensis]|uniref:Uncharacterized protein n=1 Tax=Actinoplanes derwentensis TaxID=113562 RepID=A0A1H1Q1X0_9ACTN|nr:hypothetical protein [Actinoplanes derwentensis]GID82260.1 hypothetical protein Ade03nite_11840 [Actinoplanes derwentensis]SDS17333.1 hypothetical protein SAMN04489716_0181 [Actinoplanes derwentensis]